MRAYEALADLILPTSCAGCAVSGVSLRSGVCADCVAAVAAMRPRETRPTPAPDGLPLCVSLGSYADPLRSMIVNYKDRNRHRLAKPLGALLGAVVAEVAARRPVLLIPVPDTPGAARERHGDHMARLTRIAARRLRAAGTAALIAYPLKAMPRADSTHLSAADRARTARDAFAVRPARVTGLRAVARGRLIFVVDDVLTTGSTLAVISERLAETGVEVAAGVTLAATELRRDVPIHGV
ncbi:MAG: ComF family protein [Hamadaea sp.]|uniref:ComF family protein n=1 Tax=Hamadaea sp. TaxID=2024425 RepID=UPI0017BD48F2|nr:ComF family protein [Hamadaea sp.]NUR70751.1 ComF family protein [Hamadaea sp.]NUT23935.1 ComF family protein [Hamadaea sp.]